jgi:carbonic anhydrase
VANVAHTNIVQNAWDSGQSLSVHGWIYDIRDGLLKQLTPIIDSVKHVPEQYRAKKPIT